MTSAIVNFVGYTVNIFFTKWTPAMPTTIPLEERQVVPYSRLDENGYHPKATEFLIKLLSKPAKMIAPPSQDIDAMMQWLEEK